MDKRTNEEHTALCSPLNILNAVTPAVESHVPSPPCGDTHTAHTPGEDGSRASGHGAVSPSRLTSRAFLFFRSALFSFACFCTEAKANEKFSRPTSFLSKSMISWDRFFSRGSTHTEQRAQLGGTYQTSTKASAGPHCSSTGNLLLLNTEHWPWQWETQHKCWTQPCQPPAR